jgi:D-sedoheptulose 7-phosphate isomerase
MKDIIEQEINAHINVAEQMHGLSDDIAKISSICIDSIRSGGKVLIFGNGGSAADAQHIAAELVGRYKSERKGLPAVALTTDTSALTSIGNDLDLIKFFKDRLKPLPNQKM